MDKLLNRFLNYVRQDTRPDETSGSCPSSILQLLFAEKLAVELEKTGLSDVTLDGNGYIMATLPSNSNLKEKVIGFIAHMDTSPEAPSDNINPRVHRNYDGGDILLDPEKGVRLSPDDFSELSGYKGQTIITSDGNTLLGADDKAGVAEIVTAMEYLINHPELKHGKIRIAFTPDEEIGRGADKFDVAAFGADFAYTVDGGKLGELEYENFNAASATVKITGRSVHPGSAMGTMINSIRLSQELNSALPESERPEYTENYEGFFHLYDLKGSVEETTMKYIIRDHDMEKFNLRKKMMSNAVNDLRNKYKGAEIALTMKDQYFNMKEVIEASYFIIDRAVEAYKLAGVSPVIKPVRGGTDGARLSFMGLPCPNIFTGGHNYHGRFEYIPLESMEKAVEVIVNISLSDK
jgi:tripeptide aminopeptidase